MSFQQQKPGKKVKKNYFRIKTCTLKWKTYREIGRQTDIKDMRLSGIGFAMKFEQRIEKIWELGITKRKNKC